MTGPSRRWRPQTGGRLRSNDAGESWHEVSENLPTDFGFALDIHSHEPTPSTSPAIISYFAFVNRVADGLGVALER